MNTRHFKDFWQMESTNQRDGSFGLFQSAFAELFFTTTNCHHTNPQIIAQEKHRKHHQRDGSFDGVSPHPITSQSFTPTKNHCKIIQNQTNIPKGRFFWSLLSHKNPTRYPFPKTNKTLLITNPKKASKTPPKTPSKEPSL